MARSINSIQDNINKKLRSGFEGLSDSQSSEWNLLTWVVAAAIHSFEVVLDLFKSEVDAVANKITAGTTAWYLEMCYRFQYKWKDSNGEQRLYALKYDPDTAMYYYPVEDEQARIIKAAAIISDYKQVTLRVATLDEESGELVRLDDEPREAFKDYIKTISMAGIPVMVQSRDADILKYQMTIYYDPAYPGEDVKENARQALAAFKTDLTFNAMFYKQRLIECIMHLDGVTTVDAKVWHRESEGEYEEVDIMCALESGYFNYQPEAAEEQHTDDDSWIEMKSTREDESAN